jgi:hypothetical protein
MNVYPWSLSLGQSASEILLANRSRDALKMILQRGEVQSPLGNRVTDVTESSIRCLVEARVPQERANVHNLLDGALLEKGKQGFGEEDRADSVELVLIESAGFLLPHFTVNSLHLTTRPAWIWTCPWNW